MPTDKRQRQKQARRQRQEAMRIAQQRANRRRQGIRLAVILLVVVGLLLLVGVIRDDGDGTNVATDDTTTTTAGEAAEASFGTTACPPADASGERKVTFEASFEKCIDEGKTYTATIETDLGTLEIDLAAAESPVTVNNFVALARHRFYENVVCHRVIKGFVIQCGDPEGTGQGGPGYTIGEEPPASGKYAVGQLAMAKTQAPNSTGSQFFIIVGEQGAQLPPQYSLLGTVTAGMDVAKKIEADGADRDPTPPTVVHKILKVTIKES